MREKCEIIDGEPLFCATLWRRIRRQAPTSNRACGLWVAFGWIDGQKGRPGLHGAILREHPQAGPAILINYCPFCGGPVRDRTGETPPQEGQGG